MLWTADDVCSKATQIPWFDEWWNKNPWIAMWRQPSAFPILKLTGEFMSRRKSEEKDGGGAECTDPLKRRDMLSRFMEIQSTNESIPPW